MNERATRIRRKFDLPIGIAAISVIPTLIVQESQAGQPYETIAAIVNVLSWSVFVAELVTMLVVVDSRRKYLLEHPLDLIVVVLTPPILPPGFESLRTLRMLRLLRLVGIARLSPRLFTLEGIKLGALFALMTMIFSGLVFAAVESRSSFDGVWWSFTTMTTIGSDIYPHTVAGRIIAAILILVGISFVALMTGAIARRFLQPHVVEIEEELAESESLERDLLAQLAAMSKQIAEMETRLRRQMNAKRAGST